MAIVQSVVELLLLKLADPLIQEAIFLHGVRDQVELLVLEFEQMEAFLEDADAKQEEGDRRVKRWVKQVRDVAHDAEDVIDTFVFKIATSKRRGFLGCIRRYAFTPNELVARHEVGSEIQRIKNKIRAISESRLTYGIENIGQGAGTSSVGLSLRERRIISPNVDEPDFVGFEKDLEALVSRLTKGELRRSVVSVVGMGGLGKTTLTKKLYNTDSVKKHFNAHAWISVSQEYAVRGLLLALTKQFMAQISNEIEKMNGVELTDNISKLLNDKRYLVVLDDIWKYEAWDALKNAFPDMNNGSRVVLTTRNKDVALHADAQSQPHELQFLNKEESWKLFCKKTFPGQNNICPPDLDGLGREIVSKCQGLPLAIAVIGGLLSRKEPREWVNVRKSFSWQLVEGEIKISDILSLSYKDLPYYLKPCFLYLGNFPEDYEFRTKQLIQLWVAEGLLQQRGELTMEEVGEDYLKELIQRSMVQVSKKSSSGGIKSCCIHDLLRDLSISEAKEGMFLQVVHRGSGNANALGSPTLTARRVAIHHNDSSKFISLKSSTPYLRSVLIYTQGSARPLAKPEKFPCRGFKLLRVLYLHGLVIEKLPREIGELIHLRYLSCTNTMLERLPSSIGNLSNLQTLFVASHWNIKVPSTIGKMQQLRHFQLKKMLPWIESGGEIEWHPRLEQISNLQTLSLVKAGKWMEKDCLGKLTNLRKLGILIEKRAHAKIFYESIVKMDCLQSLSVLVPRSSFTFSLPFTSLQNLRKLYLQGMLETLPESREFPSNLTKLTLKNMYLKEDPMATLEKLKNLRILRLLGSSYTGKEVSCSAQGFPLLESLHLVGLEKLEEWRVEEGAMPSLLYLRVSDCLKLKKLPEGLQHVTTLKKLELWYMLNELKERLKEDRGEDWHKIRHIPSIDIRHEYEKPRIELSEITNVAAQRRFRSFNLY